MDAMNCKADLLKMEEEMTKHEFLSELRTALEGNIPSQEVEENIRYYDSYFSESHKPEKEVCEELGDPRLIARSLIDSFTASKGPMADYYREQARSEYSRESHAQGGQDSDMGEKWYDRLFRYIMFASIAIIVGAVLIFLVRVAVTVVIPVIVIVLIVKLLVDLFRRY